MRKCNIAAHLISIISFSFSYCTALKQLFQCTQKRDSSYELFYFYTDLSFAGLHSDPVALLANVALHTLYPQSS